MSTAIKSYLDGQDDLVARIYDGMFDGLLVLFVER